MASEDVMSETLEWFRSNFSHAEKDGRISLRDFKQASHRNCHVSNIIHIMSQLHDRLLQCFKTKYWHNTKGS